MYMYIYICIYIYKICISIFECIPSSVFFTALEHGPLIGDLAMNMVISHSYLSLPMGHA